MMFSAVESDAQAVHEEKIKGVRGVEVVGTENLTLEVLRSSSNSEGKALEQIKEVTILETETKLETPEYPVCPAFVSSPEVPEKSPETANNPVVFTPTRHPRSVKPLYQPRSKTGLAHRMVDEMKKLDATVKQVSLQAHSMEQQVQTLSSVLVSTTQSIEFLQKHERLKEGFKSIVDVFFQFMDRQLNWDELRVKYTQKREELVHLINLPRLTQEPSASSVLASYSRTSCEACCPRGS